MAAWFVLGRDASPPCNGLAEEAGVQKSMGAAVHPGMSCAALGEAIVKSTAGSDPGRHTPAQAQAVRDVLFALGSGQSKKLDLDPALRLPLATALADHAPDVHEMLAGLDSEYVMKQGRDTPPWEAGGTYHLAANTLLRKILPAVAEDPEAYAVLRTAETRTAAERLAAVPAAATGADLSLPPTKNARAFGTLDGVADTARSKDASKSQEWYATLFEHLIDEQPDRADPAGHLTATWLQELKNTPETARAERLHTQGLDMARTWAQARAMDEQTRQGLLAEVESSALYAYREMKP
ncbi:hypothetical protein OG749_44045 [Streptomyces nojiriensis]|uniref:hypothetical protein n=1 Tax=Streptomyces nojiriensis TaxID=66374 RepID=UPI002E1904CD